MMCEYDSKLLKLVVDDTQKAIFGLIIVSTVLMWTYMNHIPSEYLFLWGVSQALFILLRFYNAKMLSKYLKNGDEIKLKFHTVVLAVIVLYSAVVWSSITLLGAIYAPTPYEFISLAVIMGIVTAAVLSLTPIYNLFLGYFFILILVQAGVMFSFGTDAHLAIIIFLVIFMPMIVLLSKSIYKNHLSTIDTQNMLESHVSELKELSITDSLTKVYNRRHFFESAQTLVSIAKREDNEISFLMIDIDYFKNVNDTYGHQIGDYVLVRLSQEIKSMIRDGDLLARIGGEEFALLLPNTSLKGATIIAEKIRSSIEKIDFNDNYITVDVTVSIGCASLGVTIRTLEELYQDADKKLYIAKELGRNRVQ